MLGHEIVMETSPHAVPALHRNRKILLVDDDEAVRDVLSGALSLMQYEVTLACNGLEALTLFHRNFFDLVLTDLHMPIMDGGRLSRLVKEQSPNTPVIMMTGAGNHSELWENLNTSFIDSIMSKPFNLKELEEMLQKRLNTP